MNRMMRISLLSILSLLTCLLISCSAKKADGPVILIFNGKPVYMAELDVLAQLALNKAGLSIDSEEGQKRYHAIAPNLYETLITTYTLKSAAEVEGYMPTPDELEKAFEDFKAKTSQQKSYDTLMNFFKISEEQLKDTLKYHIAMQKLQNAKIQSFKPEEPTEKEIEDFYYKNHALFRYPKRMRASQIYLSVPKEADDAARLKIRQRMENIQKMIGENPAKTFVGLAQKYSEDPATAKRGGDMGFIDRDGNIPDSFKKAAFSLKLGKVSDIVETNYGYHIIWATDHEENLEEAKKEIKQLIIKQKVAEQFVKWIKDEKDKMDIVRLFDPVKFEVIPQKDKA